MADLEIRWREAELRRLHDRVGPIARDLDRRGHNVMLMAQSLAPVLTGKTRAGIVSEVDIGTDGDPYVDILSTAVNERGFPYPMVHEFKDPFLRPAIDAARR